MFWELNRKMFERYKVEDSLWLFITKGSDNNMPEVKNK